MAPISDNSTTKKLQKLFKISTKTNKSTGTKEVTPATIDYATGELRAVKMNTDIQRVYNEWKNDLVSVDDLKNRMQRYSDLDFMVLNCGFIGVAVKLYANETISPDESGKIIHVYARDKKVEKYINDFFEKIGITRSILENASFDLAKFSDHFWIRSIDPKDGIVEITPIDVKQIKDRIEFSAIDELTKQYNRTNWLSVSNKTLNIDDLVSAITTKVKDSDYAALYKRYLFGFSLGEDQSIVLPPWAISHFRRFTTQSEFAPFGRPLLINSLSIFREYKSALNLLAMARVAKFPKEVYKVTVDQGMTPTEKMLAMNEARQEWQNLVEYNNGREELSVGSSIWTIDGLITFELMENTMNLGDIADVELLKDELISSTLVPKGYLITGEASWGDAGKALLQQSKIFAREVYTNQTAILNELTDLVKTQFVLTNQFDGEDTEFELSLAFPNSEQASENITNQKETMDLANAVIENLKTALAIDSIPPDVAKDIFRTYASLNTKDLDKWFDKIQATVDLQIKQPDYEEPKYESVKIKEALGRMDEDIFREAYFNAKKEIAFTEGVFNCSHFKFNYTTTRQDKVKFEMMKFAFKEKEELKD